MQSQPTPTVLAGMAVALLGCINLQVEYVTRNVTDVTSRDPTRPYTEVTVRTLLNHPLKFKNKASNKQSPRTLLGDSVLLPH